MMLMMMMLKIMMMMKRMMGTQSSKGIYGSVPSFCNILLPESR